MSPLPQRYQHLTEAPAANDNDLTELRRTLAALDALRALIARAQILELELRTQEQELRLDTSREAVDERAALEQRLAELDDIVRDGWYGLPLDRIDRLADWVDG